MKLTRLLPWFFSLMLLVACSGPQVRPTAKDPVQVWRLQQKAVEKLTSWELSGRIAIQTESDGFNANFSWRQQDDDYRIQLSGPFGVGALTLTGDSSGVALHNRGETVFHHDDAEALLLQQTGVQLPVSSLRYWVRGIPQQGAKAKVMLDSQGRLKELQQFGWKIHYKRYSRYRGLMLPAKLFLDNRQLKVRVVIDHWVLAALPGLQQQSKVPRPA